MGRALQNNPDLLGTTVVDTYKLVNILGAGTFGVVYGAIDLTTPNHQRYAVKVLRNATRDAKFHAQEREWSTQMMVHDHPNILDLHFVYVIGPFIYLIFDFCPGGNLLSSINNNYYRVNDETVKQSFIQLIDAVQYCHTQGVAHRDLKPENILCSEDRAQLFIADFGLATTDTYTTHNRVGSRFYMSPECLGEQGAINSYSTQKSDIWCLGIILANMICGMGLWRRAAMDDKIFRDFQEDPNYLRYYSSISQDANDILRTILTVNPDDRISLARLREKIMDIDTFFAPDIDVSCTSDSVALVTRSANAGLTGMRDAAIDDIFAENLGSVGDLAPPRPRLSPAPFDWTPRPADEFFDVTLVSSSSPAQSALPITPEGPSRADVDVVDVSGVAHALDALGISLAAEPANQKPKVANPGFWRHTLQKIKALS